MLLVLGQELVACSISGHHDDQHQLERRNQSLEHGPDWAVPLTILKNRVNVLQVDSVPLAQPPAAIHFRGHPLRLLLDDRVLEAVVVMVMVE